eukprot:TRINITY_DN1832_c0_g1_i1.p1 TRINITY_DN1832_c0_g1~~TRINITY_DN1832_c0_g1_i1.p1  ORF type:complete len:847 (+),score=167.28 TRINITY_DN1832_c0_g1_i1:123-2663(+)
MKTLVRVIQYGFLAFFIHFGDKTIFGQQKPKTEFFKSDQIDSFDEVNEKLMKINEDNCGIKHVGDLYLPDDTVSHKIKIKDININPVLPNRTDMLHIHNMALSRSFFFSFILQARFNRPTANETYDPGLMYYYLSTIADVAANPRINASAIYFSPNMSYSPSYRGFFNLTMPLFAPRTFRADDYNDPIHLERISTLNMFVTKDLGAIPDGNLGNNYTSDYYRINEWYKKWLPDNAHKEQLHDTKTVYDVRIRYANNTNATFSFHGPPGADENPGPVKWTRPYFDCGRSNTWKFAASVPIADIYPRQTQFRHIEYPSYVAVAVIEMNFDRIDINQCPIMEGNPAPNKFADTAKCKKQSTFCEPLHGYGFRRGGYQCRCNPNHRLPNIVRRPYLGEIIERASRTQYMNPENFQCPKVGFIQKLPVQKTKSPEWMKTQYTEKYYEYTNFTTEPEDGWNLDSLHQRKETGSTRINIDEVLNFIHSVDEKNCHKKTEEELNLKGDITFGAEEQFKNEALMAVRTANFISAFLQVVDPSEVFPGTRIVDRPLNEDQMIGEALAMVMGNSRVWSAGIYFDANQFTNRTYFAPYAYKKQFNTRKFEVEDLARLNTSDTLYTNKKWFKKIKSRWGNFYDNLEKHWLKMFFRSRSGGRDQSKFGDGVYDDIYLRRYEHFPEYYRAANLEQGIWTAPYFDCNGLVPRWKITYASPFFGWNSLRNRIEFKGAVAVSMDIKVLDVNQCPGKYYTPNAFKRTHKCDDKTSYCVPILGRGFSTGGYKCECKQGYEYPFEDPIDYFDGQRLDAEFVNLVEGKENWFDMYKCRLAAANGLSSSITVTIFIVLVCILLKPSLHR